MTVDKILNESGRMQKIRKEKEEQEALKKTNHNYRKLPADEVVVRYISNIKGEKLFLDKTIPSGNWLLNNHELSFYGGELKTGKHKCLNCGNIAKYHLEKPKILHFCSIGCYAKLKLIN